jgi:hypothetical protein
MFARWASRVSDGDLGVVGDDEDLLEALLGAEHVLDLVQIEHAGAGQPLDDGVGGISELVLPLPSLQTSRGCGGSAPVQYPRQHHPHRRPLSTFIARR